MEASVQGIFTAHFAQYAQGKRLSLRSHQAAQAIIQCRTAALGGHVQCCPEGHVARMQYHSCRHRSCPRCAALPKARWAEAQHARLLACDHFHVVFTVPHELLGLWSLNRAWFIDALFQSSRDTLMTLLKDPRYLGAEPGIVMALHTWGRTLSLHPHIHCLVTGGGLTSAGDWKAVRGGYLLPIRVVKALYRGKLLARLWGALRAGTLRLPDEHTPAQVGRLLKALSRKAWNVRLQERYAHGRGVLRYLARYVKGGPISDRRLLSADAERVCFRYRDHRDGRDKRLALRTEDFMKRVLWHVPEPGQHTIRHYGLYAHRSRAKRATCRAALGQAPEAKAVEPLDWATFLDGLQDPKKTGCPVCGQRLVVAGACRPRRNTNSLAMDRPCRFVQPGVQVHAPTSLSDRGPPASGAACLFLRLRGVTY